MSRIRSEIKPVPPAHVCAHFGVTPHSFCTINEAMARLGLSRVRVRELIEQGRLGVPRQQWGQDRRVGGVREAFRAKEAGAEESLCGNVIAANHSPQPLSFPV
jgi:hypothetical protein